MNPRKPNVLLFFTDQQRADTIHALGNPVIRTPNLDRLCRDGVAFTSAYSASPVCISARCSMIHGQYPFHTGCYENRAMCEEDRQTHMTALTNAGFRTHAVGKCHFSPDRHAMRGFQTREKQEEICRSVDEDDYLQFLRANGLDHLTDPHGVRGEMYYTPQPAQMSAKFHPTQWVGDRTVAFIEEQADKAEPWYLFSSFVHPHPPWAPPAPWHKLYRAPLMPLPNVPHDYESLWTYVNRYQNRYKYRDQGIDLNLLRGMKAYYYACISFIDFQVGRALDALERAGRMNETLIIFMADHGEHLGDYYCFGKRSMHDTCARIPMIARYPGVFEGGRVCDTPVSAVDVTPTILAATGAEITDHELDGIDLAETAAGKTSRDMVISQFRQQGLALYMGLTQRWKYVYSAADNKEFLFDRVNDPRETRNKAGLVFLRETLAEMRSATMDIFRAGGESAGMDGDKWRTYPKYEMPDDPDALLLIQDSPWADQEIPGYTDADSTGPLIGR